MAKAENTVIFDGIKYNPGDELPDLGSWVCTDARGMVRDYEGLSKDVAKLPHYVKAVHQHYVLIRPNYTNITNQLIHGTN